MSWGGVLELAFLGNVIYLAAILLFLFLPGTSYFQGRPPSTGEVGALFSVGVAVAAASTAFAVLLVFLGKSLPLYLSSVAAHVVEVCLLVVVFALGTTSS